jgi:hypothetical protein
MDGRDILSWLLALAAVGAIVAGAFVTLAALRPEAIEFEATEVTGATGGRDLHLTHPETSTASIARDSGLLLRG